MKLYELLEDMGIINIRGSLNIDIKGISYDSRLVSEGFLFLCIDGNVINGHSYIEEAIIKGAVAIVSEKPIKLDFVTVIHVDNSRAFLPIIASRFYNKPTNVLKLIGITGTNGKTTTTFLLKSILEEWGKKVGLIGTITTEIGNRINESIRTTPESLDLQFLLREMLNEGFGYAVIEVSSHSLEQRRVDGCKFHIGAFTNLTQDHLDYHKTMDNYRRAKEKLFYMTKFANILNADDAEGQLIINNVKCSGIPVFTYGIDKTADIIAKDIRLGSEGVIFDLITPDYTQRIHGNIPGKFSVYNILAAASIAYVEGVDKESIYEGIKRLKYVPGRMEAVYVNAPYKILIDYAHTPSGLENVLKTIKQYAKGRIITVFGCGGDRDKEKRPIMGKIAGMLSDYCIITSDNPRTEDPYLIIKEIEKGIINTNCSYICIENRKEAIFKAITLARFNDIILLAGKGHERYQVLRDKTINFDERDIIKGLLKGRD